MTDMGGRLSENSQIDLAMQALDYVRLLKPARRDQAYERGTYCLEELIRRLEADDRRPEPLERIATVLEKWDKRSEAMQAAIDSASEPPPVCSQCEHLAYRHADKPPHGCGDCACPGYVSGPSEG